MSWLDLVPLTVELVLFVGAMAVLVTDLILPPGDKRVLTWGSLGVLLAALVGSFVLDTQGAAFMGSYVSDGVGLFFKRIFLLSGLMAVLAAHQFGVTHWPRRQGEYYLLVLFSVLGMSLLSGARDLMLLLVSFELMGMPLYALAAWQRRSEAGAEGALKLYLVGAVSTVVTMYGFSMLYGMAGTSSLAGIGQAMASHPTPLLGLGASLALAGMSFKIGVVPFHMWVPDTYQGAPTPFITFLSVGPKAAGMAALTQLLLTAQAALLGSVVHLLLLISAGSLILATLQALPQNNVKRLLAYSGIGHMGLLLMGFATGEVTGLASVLFYLMGYLFTTTGVFFVVNAVREAGGDDSLDSFAGLGRRSWFLAGSMLVFLLSLGGIPFVVGFWAKLFVFMAAWKAGFAWLVVLGVLISIMSLYYYLRVVRAMFMVQATVEGGLSTDWATRLGVVISLLAVVGMGLAPEPLYDAALRAAQGFFG